MAMVQYQTVIAKNTMITLSEALLGLLLGITVGGLLGFCMSESSKIARVIQPYIVASNAVPVIAIAPLIGLWFGHGMVSKVIVAAFLCFFPTALNVYRGLTEIEPIYKELFSMLGSNRIEFFAKYKLPHSLPFIFSGLRLSAVYAVIGAIVAEFAGADGGLGFGMLQSSYNLNTPRLFAYLLIACLLGIGLYGIVGIIEYIYQRKYGK